MREGRQVPESRCKQPRPTELGHVRLLYNPGPDAQDRLRRAFAIILAAARRQSSESPDHSSSDDVPYEASRSWPPLR